MRIGLILSIFFHIAVVSAVVVGLPSVLTPPVSIPDAIPVEFVVIAEETTLPPQKDEPEEKRKEVTEEPPPPPPLPMAEAAPPDAVPLPEAKPKPKKSDLSRAPVPHLRPKPPPRRRFEMTRIAALLDKRLREQPNTIVAKADQAARSISMDQRMTISETDAIKLQIQSCWSLPAGARDAENLVVKLRLFLNPDGSLARAPEIVDRARMNQPGQEFFRTAAESAVRAVRKCEPLRLPPGKYDHWREMVLTFDPRDMFGG